MKIPAKRFWGSKESYSEWEDSNKVILFLVLITTGIRRGEMVGEREMFHIISVNSYFNRLQTKFFLNNASHESLIWGIRRSKVQMIQISMNINRIINKYIISKYVKRENKPG